MADDASSGSPCRRHERTLLFVPTQPRVVSDAMPAIQARGKSNSRTSGATVCSSSSSAVSARRMEPFTPDRRNRCCLDRKEDPAAGKFFQVSIGSLAQILCPACIPCFGQSALPGPSRRQGPRFFAQQRQQRRRYVTKVVVLLKPVE